MPGSLQRTLQALAYFSAWFEVFSWRVIGTTEYLGQETTMQSEKNNMKK